MDTSWQSRQVEMEGWYRHLAADQDAATSALRSEYQPYGGALAKLTGLVLDVGGGAGLPGAYLRPDAQYFVIDPSTIWRTETWGGISQRLSPSGARPSFVLGVGERLPFPAHSFDAALAFWSLNHASDPRQCILEIHRVLKPNGKALLVLEDMEPAWSDTAKRAWQSFSRRLGRHIQQPIYWHQDEIKTVTDTIRYKLSGQPWPLQTDHLRIEERDLRGWFRQRFRVVDRNWDGGFLSYELEHCA